MSEPVPSISSLNSAQPSVYELRYSIVSGLGVMSEITGGVVSTI